MFIKLEKIDGRAIWLNAAFIVTVEPRKDGGSVVVPVGDGLDYDVKESPETVLALLDGAPTPAIMPILSTDALKTSASANDEKLSVKDEKAADKASARDEKAATDAPAKPAARKASTTRKRTTRKAQTQAKAAEEKPVVAKTEQSDVTETAEPKSEGALGDQEIERLRKMAPRSTKKLRNTLSAQFKIKDADSAIRYLEMRGVLAVERDHVAWK